MLTSYDTFKRGHARILIYIIGAEQMIREGGGWGGGGYELVLKKVCSVNLRKN